jgi:hypothetical protein
MSGRVGVEREPFFDAREEVPAAEIEIIESRKR